MDHLGDIQLNCQAGLYSLDIFLRRDEHPGNLEVVGLVALAERAFEPVADLAVALVDADGKRAPSGTRTDEFGEFDFTSPPAGTLGLRVGSCPDAPCVLLWAEEAA